MAVNKEVKTKVEEDEIVVVATPKKEINMNDKSKLKNVRSCDVGWYKTTSSGETTIASGKTAMVRNEEIVDQVENDNVFLCGTGNGDHASVIIENEELRKYLGFENQTILTDKACKEILAETNTEKFKELLDKYVVLKHERSTLLNYALVNKFDSISRLEMIRNHLS